MWLQAVQPYGQCRLPLCEQRHPTGQRIWPELYPQRPPPCLKSETLTSAKIPLASKEGFPVKHLCIIKGLGLLTYNLIVDNAGSIPVLFLRLVPTCWQRRCFLLRVSITIVTKTRFKLIVGVGFAYANQT